MSSGASHFTEAGADPAADALLIKVEFGHIEPCWTRHHCSTLTYIVIWCPADNEIMIKQFDDCLEKARIGCLASVPFSSVILCS